MQSYLLRTGRLGQQIRAVLMEWEAVHRALGLTGTETMLLGLVTE